LHKELILENVPFNRPAYTGNEDAHVIAAMRSEKISGDAHYGKLCQRWFEADLGCLRALLTPSCTSALEMAALLVDIIPGDEVVMPSFTFVSTANAFVLRGARIVFVDICQSTLNMDAQLLEAAITRRTKAIVVVHYAGVACEMSAVCEIAERHGIVVIEDAAQGVMSTYKGRPLGSIGHIGTYSFHETKNITSGGEGGLLIVNDERFVQRAEIIREKGTNRSLFFRGEVDKYTWVDLGSSYLPSEIQSAYLWGQLERSHQITSNRLDTWHEYQRAFLSLEADGLVDLPAAPPLPESRHNAHIFHLRCKDALQRSMLIKYLKNLNISAVFHYVPLHSAPAGLKYGRFHGVDRQTTRQAERIVRLPIWYGMNENLRQRVIDGVTKFFKTGVR